MKKRFSLICSLLVLVIGCAMIFVGCGVEEIGQNHDEFKFNYKGVEAQLNDGIDVDGKLTESVYSDAEWFESDRCGVKMRVTTVYGKNGLYVAADADVEGVYYVSDAQMNKNSYLEVKITTNLDGSNFDSEDDYACLQTSAKYAVSTSPRRFYARAFVKGGALNTNDSTGMSAEFYIPWSELGVNEAPEQVGIYPFYIRTYTDKSAVVSPETIRYSFVGAPSLFWKFDKNGYAFNDAEDAAIGDSATGVSKTSGWDLSRESEGIVSTNNSSNQWIFITEAQESDYYSIEATVSATGGINDSDPQVGILVGNNELDEIIAVNFKCAPSYISSKRLLVKELNYSSGYFKSDYRWKTTELYDSGNNSKYDISNGVKLKAYKIGKRMLVFADGTLVADKELDEFKYKAVPGLYSVSAAATWKNVNYVAFGDYSAALSAAAAESGTNLVNASAVNNGGNVTADKVAVAKGEGVKFTITSNIGNEVDKITLNGADVTSEVASSIADGVYTYTATQNAGVIDFKVSFKATSEQRYIMTGKLLPDASFDRFESAPEIIILNKNNALVRYETSASATSGSFMMALPQGEYTFVINAKSHVEKRINVTVSSDDTIPDTQLESSRGMEVNATVRVNGTDVKGNQMYSYGNKSVYNTTASTLGYTFLLGSVNTSCMISAKINLIANPTDNDPSAGFVFSANSDVGNKGFYVVFIRDGYRYGLPYVSRTTVEGKAARNIKQTKDGDSVKMTVVRNGATFNIYFDDVLKGTIDISDKYSGLDFSGNLAAGFFSGGCTALFSDYTFTTDSSTINAYVNAHK